MSVWGRKSNLFGRSNQQGWKSWGALGMVALIVGLGRVALGAESNSAETKPAKENVEGVGSTSGTILPEGWQYRRALVVKNVVEAGGKTAGSNTFTGTDQIAWAEFYTNGEQKPDGSDFRVTNAERVIVPMRILQMGPDHDFVRIAFAVGRGPGAGGGLEASPSYIWWGRKNADKNTPVGLGETGPGPQLEIKRGLLAEVYRGIPNIRIDNAAGLEKAFKNKGKYLGAEFLPELKLGYEPINDETGAMIHYSGSFKLDNAATLDLALAVKGWAGVKIDDKSVLFQRGVQQDARHTKSVKLDAGWHKLAVDQVTESWDKPDLLLACRKDGAGSFVPLGGNAIAPVQVATAGPLDTVGKPYTADFTLDGGGEIFCPPSSFVPRYVVEYKPNPNFKKVLVHWDFGDGTTSTLAKVHHYYLTPGVYTITLTVKPTDGTNTHGVSYVTQRRLKVGERLVERFPKPPVDPKRTVRQVLDDYDLTKLSGANLLRGMLIFKQHELSDEWMKWGQAWLENNDPVPGESQIWQETYDLQRMMRANGMEKQGVEMWHLASKKKLNPDLRANLLRWYAVRMCDDVDQAGPVYQELEEVLNNPPGKGKEYSPGALRQLHLGLMYAALGKGDGKLAEKWGHELKPLQEDVAKRQIDQGVWARNIEAAIGSKEYDQADQLLMEWEAAIPQAMLDGFTRLLKFKLLWAEAEAQPGLTESRKLLAARVAEQFARSRPESFYAAELWYRAVEGYRGAGKQAEAQRALEQLKSKYPESPYSGQ